jgi:hypothetical protein
MKGGAREWPAHAAPLLVMRARARSLLCVCARAAPSRARAAIAACPLERAARMKHPHATRVYARAAAPPQQLQLAAAGGALPALGCSVTSIRSSRCPPLPAPSASMPGSAAAILRNSAYEQQARI